MLDGQVKWIYLKMSRKFSKIISLLWIRQFFGGIGVQSRIEDNLDVNKREVSKENGMHNYFKIMIYMIACVNLRKPYNRWKNFLMGAM